MNIHWKDGYRSWISNTLASCCEELTHLKKPCWWEGLRMGGEGDERGWVGWMASLTQWTSAWVDSGSWWCRATITSSVTSFSSCPQSFPALGSCPISWLFISGSQSIGASASASVLPVNIHGWFPLGLTGLISLPSKGLLRVFSSTTIRKHQFFGA